MSLVNHNPIIPRKCPVLVLPRKPSALIRQCRCNHPLYVIRNIMAGLVPCATSQVFGQFVQERDFVSGTRVHEEVKRVHALPPSCRCAVEHAHAVHHGHGDELVGEFGEQGGESEEEGLSAGCAFRADC